MRDLGKNLGRHMKGEDEDLGFCLRGRVCLGGGRSRRIQKERALGLLE